MDKRKYKTRKKEESVRREGEEEEEETWGRSRQHRMRGEMDIYAGKGKDRHPGGGGGGRVDGQKDAAETPQGFGEKREAAAAAEGGGWGKEGGGWGKDGKRPVSKGNNRRTHRQGNAGHVYKRKKIQIKFIHCRDFGDSIDRSKNNDKNKNNNKSQATIRQRPRQRRRGTNLNAGDDDDDDDDDEEDKEEEEEDQQRTGDKGGAKAKRRITGEITEDNWYHAMDDQVAEFRRKWRRNSKMFCQDKAHSPITKLNRHFSLGEGALGRVMLCSENQDPNAFCAVKIMDKNELFKKRFVRKAVNEKRLLQAFSHPFLLETLHPFQNNSYLFLRMEFLPGGDLFDYLLEHGAIAEPHAQFHLACIVLALEYLQYCGVVYRDLKPENVLIGADGYPKLGDFAIAKRVSGEMTFTFTGSLVYMAPEMIEGRGYTKSVDWWAVGVLAMELTCGYSPFDASTSKLVKKRIIAADFEYPGHISGALKDMIEGFLQPAEIRLGVRGGGIDDIKRHAFFAKVDWIAIYYKERKPPFRPQKKNPVLLLEERELSNYELPLRVSRHNVHEQLFREF